jgi:hypothetical protein
MNPWMIKALADAHSRDLRHQAAWHRMRTRRGWWPADSARRWRRLRRGIGFRLVEAGLHMLATTRPVP